MPCDGLMTAVRSILMGGSAGRDLGSAWKPVPAVSHPSINIDGGKHTIYGSCDRSRDQSHQFWECLLRPRTKTEHISLNFCPICAKISRIAQLYNSPSASIFSDFFRTFFWSHFSNPLINQCLCKVIKNVFQIWVVGPPGGLFRRY